MRRLVPIAAFALCLSLPLWAQHGGGHAGGSGGHGGFSGGGHAGFSGGHGAGSGGGHVAGTRGFVGARSSSGFSRGFTHVPSSRAGLSRGPYLHDEFRGSRFRNYGFRNNCYGYGCRGGYYPWWDAGYYDPYWWWDTGSSYDDDYNQNIAAAAEMNRQNLEVQQMMRQEEADGDQDIYAGSAPAPRVATSGGQNGAAFMPATVLVFRDQHKQEISNYAIVGQTLWNFAPQHTEKIPLANLDLAATTKANDDRGLTFRVPTASEAQ